MIKIKFYDNADDQLLKFAVIVSQYKKQWVFCKHKERDTFECPGGHREEGEDILTAARRELYEETGAVQYTIEPVCVYSVQRSDDQGIGDSDESFGMLFYSQIKELGELPSGFEIEKIQLFGQIPENLTYPGIQPKLMEEVMRCKHIPLVE